MLIAMAKIARLQALNPPPHATPAAMSSGLAGNAKPGKRAIAKNSKTGCAWQSSMSCSLLGIIVLCEMANLKQDAVGHSASDAEQRVSQASQFLRWEDVATIEGEGGLEHVFLDFCVIEVGEFVPLGHHGERMRLVERGVGIIDDFKIVEQE